MFTFFISNNSNTKLRTFTARIFMYSPVKDILASIKPRKNTGQNAKEKKNREIKSLIGRYNDKNWISEPLK